ncbi:hypothetical protein QUA20_22495 [Microcoleus sp. Pol7_A1]
MVQAQSKKLTFDEYLNYSNDTGQRYELIDGDLIALPPESEPNNFIANYLFFYLASSGLVPLRLIKTQALRGSSCRFAIGRCCQPLPRFDNSGT